MFSLKDKTAVITGAGSGIGRSIALCFASRGAAIHIIDLDEPGAEETVRLIQAGGGSSRFYACNVARQQAVDEVIRKILSDCGQIDILVNCAGIAHVAKLEDTREEDFEKLFNVNVKGMYNTMHACIGPMKLRKKGVILNMASVAATVGVPERFSYSMSKGAVTGMTYSVARDYIKEGIRCNCISPARVHTPFVDGFIEKNYPGQEKEIFEKLSRTQPIGRMAKPDEIAWLALYLCSDEAAFVTGCDYPIDGGFVRLNN